MNNTKLTQNEFANFILTEIKRRMVPNLETLEIVEPLKFILEFNGTKQELNLNSTWEKYQKSGDMDYVLDYVHSSIKVQEKVENISNFDLKKNLHHIFPTVRSKDFVENLKQSVERDFNVLHEDLFEERLKSVYFLWQEGFSLPINTTMLSIGETITEDEIKSAAEENLKRQGWIEPEHTASLRAGTLYHFGEGRLLFHSQFFVREWIEKHFGNEFYFSFPNKNTAFVFVPNKKAKMQHILFDRKFLLENTLLDFNSPYAISPHVYSYRHGDYQKVL